MSILSEFSCTKEINNNKIMKFFPRKEFGWFKDNVRAMWISNKEHAMTSDD